MLDRNRTRPGIADIGADQRLLQRAADAEGITSDQIVRRLMDTLPTIDDETNAGGTVPQLFRSQDAG